MRIGPIIHYYNAGHNYIHTLQCNELAIIYYRASALRKRLYGGGREANIARGTAECYITTRDHTQVQSFP